LDNETIRIKNISHSFGKFRSLSNINLDIKQGQILGVLGPSGCGKSTLIKCIIGMISPSQGSIYVYDKKMPNLEVTKHIGYMAQSDALYEDLNAYDNMMFFASLYSVSKKEAHKKIIELLELVKLSNHTKKLVKNFSGGMKRRLSLAISLIHNPKILILDEPTVGIDPSLRQEFWNEFYKLKQQGVTIIVTTHVMDEAEKCDKLVFLRDGEIIAIDTPNNLKTSTDDKTIESAFLYYSRKGV
jgi:ABC-2 type transport system ATP-binding protein